MESYQTCIQSDAPIKPGLPLLLLISLVFWGCCACSYSMLDGASFEIIRSQIIWVCFACIASLTPFLFKRIRLFGFICTGAALGVMFGYMGAASIYAAERETIGSNGEWICTLTSDASPGSFGSSAIAHAIGPEGQQAHITVQFSEEVNLLHGEQIAASFTPMAVKDASKQYAWSHGIAAVANVKEYEICSQPVPFSWIQGARRQAIDMLASYGGDQAGLLEALACGYRPAISESGAYEAYKTCGLAHLVAVSGAHLAIVLMILRWACMRLRIPMIVTNILLVVFIAAYLVFAGIPLSAIRASFMVMLALISSAAQRRSASLNALALCIIVFVATDPVTAVSASFVLSAGSTLGILLFSGLISSWFNMKQRRLADAVEAPLSMTLSSNIGTLPYSAALFSQLPLIAPVANIVATPLFTIACMAALTSAVISCVFPQFAPFTVGIAAVAAMPLSFAVEALSKIPYACIAVHLPVAPMVGLSVILGVILWLAWPQLTLKELGMFGSMSIALAALGFIVNPLLASDEVVMLNVGQGDSFLIRSQGRAVLIDTGNKDSLLRDELGKLGITHLDAVFISHPDDDHCASLGSLGGYVDVSAVYVANDLLSCSCSNCRNLRDNAQSITNTLPVGLRVGDTIKVGKFALHVIWPDRFTDEGGNTDSLCLLAETDCENDGVIEWRTLFLGDAESKELETMLQLGRMGDIDVLKVGHHGSRASLTAEATSQLDPEFALISCGLDNRYGHPTEEALLYLKDTESILRSDLQGTVELIYSKERIDVITSN